LTGKTGIPAFFSGRLRGGSARTGGGRLWNNYHLYRSDGEMGKNLTIPCCYIASRDIEARGGEAKRTLWMDGSEVFKFAVKLWNMQL